MNWDTFPSKAEAFEAFDDTPLSPPTDATIGAIFARRYSRRDVLKGTLGATATDSEAERGYGQDLTGPV
jgi:hypothetical protein